MTGVVLGALFLIPFANQDQTGQNGQKEPGLDTRIHDFAAGLREDTPYQPPGEPERLAFTSALSLLSSGSPDAVRESGDRLRPLDLTVDVETDTRTGRDYAMVTDTKRNWGVYVVDLSRAARIAIQVPHPANDLHTGEIGVELFRRLPGAVLAVAGTHRKAADGAGDVAHRADSMFHAVAEDHSLRKLPQVQLHGYDDDSLPAFDLVVSSGAGEVETSTTRLADGLADSGLRVCRAWQRDCGDLEGRRNKQGTAAAGHGAVFVHIELNRTVRDDPRRWRQVAEVVERTADGG